MGRNYLALPHECLVETDMLDDAAFGRLIRALIKFSATGEVTALEGDERFIFPRMMLQETRYQRNYDELKEKRSAAGKKGMASRWGKQIAETNDNADSNSITSDNNAITNDNEHNHTKTKTKTKTNTNTNNVYIGEKPKRKPKKPFSKPTVEEVAAYCRERSNSVDPQAFVDHYESNGWVVGRTAMKDWKAAVRTWEQTQYPKRQAYAQPQYSQPKSVEAQAEHNRSNFEEMQLLLKKMREDE